MQEEFLGALYKGGELLAAGKMVEAREHLEKAHQLEPRDEKAQNLLGLTYFKLGLFEQAAGVYELLVRDNPVDPTLRVNLGLVYLKTNNLDRCIRELETATDLDPGHQKAHNYLGLALAQAGEYARAREHFHAAGSEVMAEKMTRALVTRAESQEDPGGFAEKSPPAEEAPPAPQETVEVTAAVPPLPPPPAEAPAPPPELPALPLEEKASAPPPVGDANDVTWDVMSDEEVPSDAYRVPEHILQAKPSGPRLDSDWGAQFPAAEANAEAPDDGEMRFAEDEGPASPRVESDEAMPVLDESAVEVEVTSQDTASAELPQPRASARNAPAWLTMEAAQAASTPEPPAETQWVTEGMADVPLQPGQEAPVEQGSWASGGESSEGAAPAEGWDNAGGGSTEGWAQGPEGESWAQGAPGAPAASESAENWGEVAGGEPASESWAQGADEGATSSESSESWQDVAGGGEAAPEQSWAEGSTGAEESWAGESSPSEAWSVPDSTGSSDSWSEVVEKENQRSSDSWEGRTAEPRDPGLEAAMASAGDETAAAWEGNDQGYQGGPIPPLEMPTAMDGSVQIPTPYPSGPDLPIEVAPTESLAATGVPEEMPEEYTAMRSQRLVDIGAASGWVREPAAGPFHMSPEGLAVTVAGEVLSRMTGLVAVVGGLEVKPEVRRKRGRPTQEPFGTGPVQLQRISGNGLVYLEPGKHRFFAVDLTDTNGASVDDDGAYLREEAVFAFEEPVSFENGRITGEGLELDLVHLKGTGKALLQLAGTMKAMPIPLAAPMVVPLKRLVGWFGRVTPRLMGFGGQGAVELKGEGYALLETPGERA